MPLWHSKYIQKEKLCLSKGKKFTEPRQNEISFYFFLLSHHSEAVAWACAGSSTTGVSAIGLGRNLSGVS